MSTTSVTRTKETNQTGSSAPSAGREPIPVTKRLAVVLVRGYNNATYKTKDTLRMLRLHNLNHCVIVDDRPSYMGMLQRVYNYVAYGEIDVDTLTELIRKRGRRSGNRRIDDEWMKQNTSYQSIREFAEAFLNFEADFKDLPGFKLVFRLHPPRKGYGKRTIKRAYRDGGVTGYNPDINDLIRRMM